MKRFFAFLLFITILILALAACRVKPANSVPCPFNSTLTGSCKFKPGSEPMMANSSVPVGLGDYTYVEVTAPVGTTLTASVVNGNVWIMGEGTNSLKLLRQGSAVATVNVTAKGPDYPIRVDFDGYGKP